MDPRRAPRVDTDPKFRLVGFVTPSSSSAAATSSSAAATDLPAIASAPTTGLPLIPVIIPSPRHASPIPVPNPHVSTLRRLRSLAGSYDPSDHLLGSPPMSSPVETTSEFSDDAPALLRSGSGGATKVAASFPGNGGAAEMMMAVKPAAATPKCSLTMASVVKTLPGVSATNKGAALELQSKGAAIPSSQKQKTTRAERRAIQEAQRAAKAAEKESGEGIKPVAASCDISSNQKQVKAIKIPQKKDGSQVASPVSEKKVADRLLEKDRKKDVPHPRMQFDDIHRVEKAKRRAIVNQSEARNRVELFRHLPQYVYGTQLPDLEPKIFLLDPMHPSVYKVGLQLLSGDISGGNARCIAMLLAFQEAIKDYSTPPEKTLTRDLTARISSYVSFLIECRPLSNSMGNAIRFLKNRIAKLPHTLSESEAKSSLQSDIDRFINEKIVIADKVIVSHAVTKIRDGDVLLTYGLSSVVEMILIYAHGLGKQFRVVVVDSRPKLEGQALLRRLVSKGLYCTYTHINAISYIMHEVTRVFLGASSVLTNGTVYSRVGTACVAMVAHALQVPVLICCEAYKFHERVQLDSICSNELGDPNVISNIPGRKDLNHLNMWSENENLQLLSLSYDATPSDYVSMVITDYGMIPPSSVPVIVREYREQLWI